MITSIFNMMEDNIVITITIEKAIEKLTSPKKDIASLFVLNYSPKEISEKLNINISTTYKYLKDIKKYLKLELL